MQSPLDHNGALVLQLHPVIFVPFPTLVQRLQLFLQLCDLHETRAAVVMATAYNALAITVINML